MFGINAQHDDKRLPKLLPIAICYKNNLTINYQYWKAFKITKKNLDHARKIALCTIF